MPVRNDTLVYTGAANLEAVGGRRLVRLKNGWLVSAHIRNATLSDSAIYIMLSKDNGATWSTWAAKINAYMDNVALAVRGNVVYSIATYNGGFFQLRYWDFDKATESEAYSGFTDIDSDFSSTAGKCAMHIEGNTIYAAYSGKKSTHPNSNNIFLREGTIQPDNSIAWKDVEQWTTYNSTNDTMQHPSLAYDSGKIVVFSEYVGNGYTSVVAMARTGMANAATANIRQRYTTISGGSAQTKAGQGIFVPRHINGLRNGRLWYAFWGYDATDNAYPNLRCAYSDDSGATWTVEKLTSGNVLKQEFPTITATNQNQIIIVWQGEADVNYDIRMIKRTGDAWTSIVDLKRSTSVVSYSPQTIFDLSLHYRVPPFIYRNGSAATIGFYGDWTDITISPNEGFIGEKANRTALHSYTLNSADSLPSSAREYIDGFLVNTTSPAAGVQQTAAADQNEWDQVRFGKYGDRKNIVPQNSKFWRQGGIDAAMFAPAFPIAATTTRIRTPDALPVTGGETYPISVAVGYSMLIAEYASDYTLITYQDWYIEGEHTRTMHADTRYIVVCLRYYDNSMILPSVAPLAAPAVLESRRIHEHELRIESGDFVFSYTFDKRVATNADVLSAAKAVKDAQEVYIPKIKTDLIEAINSKGAAAITGEPFEDIIEAAKAIEERKHATGTVTSSASTAGFQFVSGAGTSFYYVEIPFSSIGFVPKMLILSYKTASLEYKSVYEETDDSLYKKSAKISQYDVDGYTTTVYSVKADAAAAYVNENGVLLPVNVGGVLLSWIAYG